MDLKQVEDIEFDGINHKDAPDYCDAFICKATYKGRDMTDDELDELNNDGGFVHQELMDYLN